MEKGELVGRAWEMAVHVCIFLSFCVLELSRLCRWCAALLHSRISQTDTHSLLSNLACCRCCLLLPIEFDMCVSLLNCGQQPTQVGSYVFSPVCASHVRATQLSPSKRPVRKLQPPQPQSLTIALAPLHHHHTLPAFARHFRSALASHRCSFFSPSFRFSFPLHLFAAPFDHRNRNRICNSNLLRQDQQWAVSV